MTAPVGYAQAPPAQRALRRFAATGPGDWLAAHLLCRLDGPVYRITSGRHTAAGLLTGLPVVHLTTTGARTGTPRTVPVLGLPTSDGLAVIASNFGRRQHPGWYHNLRAHPETSVTVSGATTAVRAVEATGELRDRIWRQALDVFPGWSAYERRARGRVIAVFLLTPSQQAGAEAHRPPILETRRARARRRCPRRDRQELTRSALAAVAPARREAAQPDRLAPARSDR